jgi:hypothetical protein
MGKYYNTRNQPVYCLINEFSADTVHVRSDGEFALHHVLLGVQK